MYADHPQKVPTLTSVSSKSYSRRTQCGVNNSETMPKLTSGHFVGVRYTCSASYCLIFPGNKHTEEEKIGIESTQNDSDVRKRGKIE